MWWKIFQIGVAISTAYLLMVFTLPIGHPIAPLPKAGLGFFLGWLVAWITTNWAVALIDYFGRRRSRVSRGANHAAARESVDEVLRAEIDW